MLSAMEIIVIQKNDDGLFGGPLCNDFKYTYSGVTYRVRIKQQGNRELRIAIDTVIECKELFSMFTFIEHLLFLFDGRFFPIEKAEVIDERENPLFYEQQVEQYFSNRINIYNSMDICKYEFMKLINFNEINLRNALIEWSLIDEELDIAYPMFMYCLTDNKMPVDCKIASFIEIAKPLCEIVEKENNNYFTQKNRSRKLDLRTALKVLIDEYGKEIFKTEISNDYCGFLDLLVNTRNKISHVKTFRNKKCLDGVQCAFYIAKLSIMYRTIIYSLINIDRNIYIGRVTQAINKWDNWYYDK